MKKGFTLIELLAVILLLALIMLIAIPVIFNLVNDGRKNAFEATGIGLVKTAQNNFLQRELSGDNERVIYVFETVDGVTEQIISPSKYPKLDFSGKPPIDGYIIVDELGNIEMEITDGFWVVKKSGLKKTNDYAIPYTGDCCDAPNIIDFSYFQTKEKIIHPVFTSSVRYDREIGFGKNASFFSVLTFNSPGYDERGILKFDLDSFDVNEIESVELMAYYYYGDIPSRQQTHPVRRVIADWDETDLLLDNMMTDTYNCRMTSLDTSGNGYGWRSCEVLDIFEYWINNPNENYGLVIDHNRGLSNAGGFWNKMQYYSINAERKYWPHLKITFKDNLEHQYFDLEANFSSSVRFDRTIGNSKDATFFSVLTFNEPGYDERGILKFNLPNLDEYNLVKAELYSYYYYGDIPSRQQTHPVRRVIADWTEDDFLIDGMMTDYYHCRMTSLDTSNYGYGWRDCDVTNIVSHWINNSNENYGLVIDHNRGLADAGGWWNRMHYHSANAETLKPYIRVYLEKK